MRASAGADLAVMVLCMALGLTMPITWPDAAGPAALAAAIENQDVDRSPVDLLLTRDERWVLVANQTAGTVSVLETATGRVTCELPCGKRPAALALTPDEQRLLVSCTHGGGVGVFSFKEGKLTASGCIRLGFEPRGVVVAPDGSLAYAALTSAGAISVIDLGTLAEIERIPVGKWPRYLALSPDGGRLAIGLSGAGGVAVMDTSTRKLLFLEDFAGINLGMMQTSNDGRHVYFPYMVYRQNRITPGNIRLGWVLASRIARVSLDRKARREAISLDPKGLAVSDPHGLAISPDEQWLVAAASGTHELLVYRLPGLPFQDHGGPGDHIDSDLAADKQRFFRIPLGGRPMATRFSRDGKHVYVANYLGNAIQVVDISQRLVVRTIPVGGPRAPSLARKGEAIFHDGQRSQDQWYSCHSCHYEGHTNSLVMDTRNDGRDGNFKVVLSLRNFSRTGPWTWHGWQTDPSQAMRKSLTDTMQGKEPSDDEVRALLAYLDTLTPPPNPHRMPDGTLSEAARRGETIFRSQKAGCISCHSGQYFTDGRIHDVGSGTRGDAYVGFNPPSLINVHDRPLLMHDGRATSLEELLTKHHKPEEVTGRGDLTEQELRDLIAYLESL